MSEHSPLEAFWDYTSVAGKIHNLRRQRLPSVKNHSVREYVDNLQAQVDDLSKINLALIKALGELYKWLDESKRTTR